MNVEASVITLIEEQVEEIGLECDEVTLESGLMSEIGLSSLDLTELVALIEDEFDVEITDRELQRIVTVGDAVEAVREKLG